MSVEEEVSSNLIHNLTITSESLSTNAMTDLQIAVDGTNATAAVNTSKQPQGSQNPTNEEAEQKLYELRKRKKSSPIWVNFKEAMVGTEKKWECIHCKANFKMVSSGTTTHLGRHIERCPRRPQNLAGQNQQQLNIVSTLNNAESVNAVANFMYDHSKMRQMIAHWLIVTEKPLSTVEHDMFTVMMKTATPLYKKISRTTS
ncbi:hypothetical protein LINPERPRIM_LOCUS25757 [Linum perenne]